MGASDVGVVVVAFDHPEALMHCLTPIASDFPIVVVDNSASPSVAAVVRSCGAALVTPGQNLGFAAGANLGLAHLPFSRSVLFLNPDAVVTTQAVRDLYDSLVAHPGVAAISPNLERPDGSRQQVSWPFPSPAQMWRESSGWSRLRPPAHEFVIGACLLVRRAAWESVGAFDERFFLYAEEADWQRRAAALGWRSMLADQIVASHVGAGTSLDARRQQALVHAGAETYVRKWFGRLGWASFRCAVITGSLARAVFGSREGWLRVGLYARGPRRVAGLS